MKTRVVSVALRGCVAGAEAATVLFARRFPGVAQAVGGLRDRLSKRMLEYTANIEATAAPSYETRRSRRLLDAARREAQSPVKRD